MHRFVLAAEENPFSFSLLLSPALSLSLPSSPPTTTVQNSNKKWSFFNFYRRFYRRGWEKNRREQVIYYYAAAPLYHVEYLSQLVTGCLLRPIICVKMCCVHRSTNTFDSGDAICYSALRNIDSDFGTIRKIWHLHGFMLDGKLSKNYHWKCESCDNKTEALHTCQIHSLWWDDANACVYIETSKWKINADTCVFDTTWAQLISNKCLSSHDTRSLAAAKNLIYM